MSFMDGLVESAFKKNLAGETVFYPWGAAGRGYVVERDEGVSDIKSMVKRFYAGVFFFFIPAIAISNAFFPIWYSFAAAAILVLVYYINVRRYVAALQNSETRLGLTDAFKTQAAHYSLWVIVSMVVGSLLFVLAGILILALGEDPLTAILCIFFFGTCLLTFVAMLRIKLALNRKPSPEADAD